MTSYYDLFPPSKNKTHNSERAHTTTHSHWLWVLSKSWPHIRGQQIFLRVWTVIYYEQKRSPATDGGKDSAYLDTQAAPSGLKERDHLIQEGWWASFQLAKRCGFPVPKDGDVKIVSLSKCPTACLPACPQEGLSQKPSMIPPALHKENSGGEAGRGQEATWESEVQPRTSQTEKSPILWSCSNAGQGIMTQVCPDLLKTHWKHILNHL